MQKSRFSGYFVAVMPIVHEEPTGKHGSRSLWKITESLDELRSMMPAGVYDLSVPEQFVYEKRRAEWYCTRLLLEHLVPGSKICYDANGKPGLEGSAQHISISHSGEYIAMIRDDRPTGIDIERIHPKIEKIASKFLSDAEMTHALTGPQPERLHAYWCIKEATYKVYGKKGVSLKSNIFVENFEYAPGSEAVCRLEHEGNTLVCKLNYAVYENFMLAWVIHHQL